MRKDKEKAVEMRKLGKSYRQIRTEMRIPLSTLSEWFKNEAWSGEIEKRLRQEAQKLSTARIVELDQIRGKNLDRLYKEARKEAGIELGALKYNPLFIAGVMLYWGEGEKGRKRSLKFSNSDPSMVKFYIRFLREACGVPLDRIKAHILIYPDHEEKLTKAYWARASGLPWENFTKSVVIQGRHPVRRLSWGVCNVSVSSTYLKEKMLEWIRLLPQELMNRDSYAKMGP